MNNRVTSPSDISDAFQITNTTFGANINYIPPIEWYVKLGRRTYSSVIICPTDQNNMPINILDPNILITLLFKKKAASPLILF
jgi:hypothetical protein